MHVVGETHCDNGDADLYIKIDARPEVDSLDADCVSSDAFSNEMCSVSSISAGASLLYATVVSFEAFVDRP
jgi:hypothetical protein